LAPLVLALVLGDMAEASFRQSMLLSQGNLAVFWSNPLVGTLTSVALLMLVWPVLSSLASGLSSGRRRADLGAKP
jgi:putative tricarboxylic transport membrane protein